MQCKTMSSLPAVLALALAAAAVPQPSSARPAGHAVHLETLAEVSGLTLRETRILFAAARSSYPQYQVVFPRAERKFVAVVGRERYQQLQAGLPVRFERMVDGRRVVSIVRLPPSA